MVGLRVFLIFFVFLSGLYHSSAACDSTFDTCYRKFYNATIYSASSYTAPELSQNIDYLLNSGNTDLLCEAQANLTQCLNSTNTAVNANNIACIFNNDADNYYVLSIVARFYQLNETCQNFKYQMYNSYNCFYNYYNPYYCQYPNKPTNVQLISSCPPTSNITCSLNNTLSHCGSINNYIGCQWESMEYKYTTNCSNIPSCVVDNAMISATTCFNNYFNAWGVSSGISFPDPQIFSNYFSTYVIAGKDTRDKACSRYSDFYNCLGGTDDVFDAFNFSQILTQNQNNKTASSWIASFQQQSYICDNGIDGLKELMECNFDYNTCTTLHDTCDDSVTQKVCQNELINYKCGQAAANFQCNMDNFNYKYTDNCKNITLDCSQYNSGSIAGIGMIFILAFFTKLFN